MTIRGAIIAGFTRIANAIPAFAIAATCAVELADGVAGERTTPFVSQREAGNIAKVGVVALFSPFPNSITATSIVDNTITIIIQTIPTNFNCRGVGLGADRGSILACFGPRTANAWFSCVTIRAQIETFIHLSIAVVIDVITTQFYAAARNGVSSKAECAVDNRIVDRGSAAFTHAVVTGVILSAIVAVFAMGVRCLFIFITLPGIGIAAGGVTLVTGETNNRGAA